MLYTSVQTGKVMACRKADGKCESVQGPAWTVISSTGDRGYKVQLHHLRITVGHPTATYREHLQSPESTLPEFEKHSSLFSGLLVFWHLSSNVTSFLCGSTLSLAFHYLKKKKSIALHIVKTKDKYLCLVDLLFIHFLQEVRYQITLKTD